MGFKYLLDQYVKSSEDSFTASWGGVPTRALVFVLTLFRRLESALVMRKLEPICVRVCVTQCVFKPKKLPHPQSFP